MNTQTLRGLLADVLQQLAAREKVVISELDNDEGSDVVVVQFIGTNGGLDGEQTDKYSEKLYIALSKRPEASSFALSRYQAPGPADGCPDSTDNTVYGIRIRIRTN